MNNSSSYWLYGRHACLAALQNANRHIKRAVIIKNNLEDYKGLLRQLRPEIAEPKRLANLLPKDAIHQGIALEVAPLAHHHLDDAITTDKPLIILDQVTDPHNVGAVLRSAAAFDAGAVIMHDRHSPKESGVMAKSASGAMELVTMVYVANISNTIEELQETGYWCVGLDGEARTSIHQAKLTNKTALVLGAEGKGLRQLTAKRCDGLVKLPMHPQMESLNVSNAAAIALYDIYVNNTVT